MLTLSWYNGSLFKKTHETVLIIDSWYHHEFVMRSGHKKCKRVKKRQKERERSRVRDTEREIDR